VATSDGPGQTVEKLQGTRSRSEKGKMFKHLRSIGPGRKRGASAVANEKCQKSRKKMVGEIKKRTQNGTHVRKDRHGTEPGESIRKERLCAWQSKKR